jgi:hypothetical protein
MATVEVDNHDELPVHKSIKYDDVDLTDYSEDELRVLGLSEEEIQAIKGEPEADEEEEAEEEEEQEAEEEVEEEEEKEEPPKKEPRIPKSRFDEAVQKEREKAIRAVERAKYLEERIEQLIALQTDLANKQNKEVEVVKEFDFDAAEDQYAQLLIEGEVAEAAKLRKEMEKARERRIQDLLKSVKEEAKATTKQLSIEEKKEVVIQEALSKYAFLDDNSEEYNKEAVEEINLLAAGYEVKNKMPAHEALKKAIERIAAPLTKHVDTKKVTAEKKTKKMEAMKKQPPETSSAKSVQEKTADDFDWDNMSQEEFRTLYKKSPKIINEALRKSYI